MKKCEKWNLKNGLPVNSVRPIFYKNEPISKRLEFEKYNQNLGLYQRSRPEIAKGKRYKNAAYLNHT